MFVSRLPDNSNKLKVNKWPKGKKPLEGTLPLKPYFQYEEFSEKILKFPPESGYFAILNGKLLVNIDFFANFEKIASN